MDLSPNDIHTHPGSRVVFDPDLPISSYQGVEVLVFFPGRDPENATVHETNNTFSFVVPPVPGEHTARVVLVADNRDDEEGYFTASIDPAQAPTVTVSSRPLMTLTEPVYADFYDPMGNLRATKTMDRDGQNFTVQHRPEADWLAGEYRIFIRDEGGVRDVIHSQVYRPDFASMPTFFSLPNWHRQVIEYIKFEMMGDTDPLHPGAFFTLEEYAKHWVSVTQEVNNVPPYTNFNAGSIPGFWSNVMGKGTLLRVYNALANASVTVPRFTGANQPMQIEDHLQQGWERRYDVLRKEYVEERAYMKGRHLPGPKVTVDPWKAWSGGSLSGSVGMGMIGRPTWVARFGG